MTPPGRPFPHFALPLTLAALALLAQARASAHSWYPIECCSGFDCRPVAQTMVRLTATGWFVVETGETIPFSRARLSPDGRFHRCSPGGRPHARTICLFVPATSS